jgi:hypothetical protein
MLTPEELLPPGWIDELVADVWEPPEWTFWNRWRELLAERQVTPSMLEPVGCDSQGRPTAVTARHPTVGWVSGEIRWDTGDPRGAVLDGLRRLVEAIDAKMPGTNPGPISQ